MHRVDYQIEGDLNTQGREVREEDKRETWVRGGMEKGGSAERNKQAIGP